MVSPGDNMARIEPVPGEEWMKVKCINCDHERRRHFDRAGCTEISQDADPKVNSFPRCHCTTFKAVKSGE